MRVLLIYLTNFLLTSSLGVVFVFLEDVQDDNGLADWELGVIVATGFGAALVAQLLLSPLADRGRTRPLAVAALAAGIVGPVGFAFGTTMPMLAASRGLAGIGLGVFGLLARKALLGLDTAGGGAKLGILLSTAVGGFILGPVIGAVLEPLGFPAPFLFVSTALALVGVPATAIILRTEIAATPVDYSDLGRLLARPKVQAAMLVNMVVFGFIGVFDVTIDRFLTELGASTTQVAIMIIIVGGPLLVFPRIAGNLAERYGAATIMFPGLILLVPAMVGYGFAGSLVVAAACGFLHGCNESFASVSAQVQVLEVSGVERAAVGSALLETAGLIAATLAAAIAPIVYGSYGPRTLYVGTAVIGAATGLIAYVRTRQGSDIPLTAAAPLTPPA
ncbi:MAG: MFS transporter [Actinomycetota bacterium]